MRDASEQFRASLSRRGIIVPGEIIADGQIHRCDAENRTGSVAASHLFFINGIPAGGFQNWHDSVGGRTGARHSSAGRSRRPVAAQRAKAEATKREREADEALRRTDARKRAEAAHG